MIATNENIAGPQPRFFLMGSLHARECAPAELAIRFAEQMVTDAFFQSCATFESTIEPDNIAALRDAFKAARRTYQTPAGPDAVSVAVSASPVTAGTSVTLTANVDDTRYVSKQRGRATLNAMAATDGPFSGRHCLIRPRESECSSSSALVRTPSTSMMRYL
ncbi:hypothetical protein [Enhygromyxa salina]|uniref:Peptidase M14 carboxypeptidase A domain-containing protein n=1 Tax=Enhygromyxa salina TaxID=215803 RepID=A0A2S9XL30_9BACT|nr:hypothetical protein [Enhygromyxa salina]PRP93586.1 hypothetical protein ENSA7_80140 [Enhygromyxa salina]